VKLGRNTAEPLVHGPSRFEAEIAHLKLKEDKLPGNKEILAELTQARCETLVSVIHRFINSLWNMEELSDQWKESIIVPIHKKDDKIDCNNYHGMSLLSTSCKILSNTQLTRLSLHISEITRDHQGGL
jgi:hypothetical protein